MVEIMDAKGLLVGSYSAWGAGDDFHDWVQGGKTGAFAMVQIGKRVAVEYDGDMLMITVCIVERS